MPLKVVFKIVTFAIRIHNWHDILSLIQTGVDIRERTMKFESSKMWSRQVNILILYSVAFHSGTTSSQIHWKEEFGRTWLWWWVKERLHFHTTLSALCFYELVLCVLVVNYYECCLHQVSPNNNKNKNCMKKCFCLFNYLPYVFICMYIVLVA